MSLYSETCSNSQIGVWLFIYVYYIFGVADGDLFTESSQRGTVEQPQSPPVQQGDPGYAEMWDDALLVGDG